MFFQNVTQDNEGLTVDQFQYAESIKVAEIPRARALQRTSDLTAEERTQYLSLLGKLAWLSYITRPDLKFDVLHDGVN